MMECVHGSGRLWGMDIIARKRKKKVWESGKVQMGGGTSVATCRRWVREALFSGATLFNALHDACGCSCMPPARP